MPIIIGLLILVVAILIFGPLAGLLAGIAAAIGLGIFGAVIVFGSAIAMAVVIVLAVAWVIWAMISPAAALEGLREAQAEHARKAR